MNRENECLLVSYYQYAGAAGVTRTANVSSLQFVKRIPQAKPEPHRQREPERVELCVRSPPTSCCSHVAAAGLRALSLHTGQLVARESHRSARATCSEWHSTRTPTHCYSSCGSDITTGSWCRCVATRASGSKCSASTPVYLISHYRVDMAVCDSRVLLGGDGEQHVVRVRRECRTHSARRGQCAAADCDLRGRVHSPRQRHARRIRTRVISVSAAARVTPTAPRADRERPQLHRSPPAPVPRRAPARR